MRKSLLPIVMTFILSALSMSAWALMPTSQYGIGYIQNWSWSCDGSQVVSVQFTLPDESYADKVSYAGLTEQWKIELRTANKVYTTLDSGTGTAGDTIKRTFTISQFNNQRVYFNVTAGVSSSDTKTIERTAWVGGGKPREPQNATVTVDDNNVAHITWQKPEAGSESLAEGKMAYVNIDSITYKVRRFPDGSYIADDVDALELTDQLPSEAYQTYYYEVYSKFRGMSSTHPSTTKRVGAGNPYEVPYFEDFSDNNHWSLFITYDGNNDNRTWITTQIGGMAIKQSLNGTDGDDWLISPPVRLVKGNVYKFSSSFMNDVKGATGNLEVYLSQHSDIEALRADNIPLMKAEVNTNTWTKKAQDFSVPETGSYRIAFHDVSKRQGNIYEIVVDSIAIDIVSQQTTPDSVTSLRAVRGDKGALTVALSFNAPTTCTDGSALNDIDSITVVRENDSTAIAKLETVEPGKAYTVNDNNALNTINTYSIYAYNVAGHGREAKVSTLFVGPDVPKAPSNVHLTDNGDNSVTLTWNAVGSEGNSGGYVDVSKVVYAVYANNDSTRALQDSITGTTYTRTMPNYGLSEQDRYKMRVIARVPKGNSPDASSNLIVFGTPYDLPFHETWSYNTGYLWYFNYQGVDGTCSPWLRTNAAADHDSYCLATQYINKGDASAVISGKINVETANHPILDYWYYNQPGTKGVLYASLDRATKDIIVVDSVDYSKTSGVPMMWQHRIVDLKPYLTNEKYIAISFRCVAGADYDGGGNEESPIFGIDDITVRDMKEHDLAAAITAPAAAKVSKPATFDVTVQNLGVQTASGYTIKLYVNGEVADTLKGSDIDGGSLTEKTFRLRYTPTAGDTLLTAYAVVEYDGDEILTNNTTATVTAKVDSALLSAINDLTATASGEKVNLSWTAPSKENASYVTDDFESYHPWDLRGFGDWKVYDRDGRPTISSPLEYWPNVGLPFAFQIYNDDDVYYLADNDHGSLQTPHSGKQMVFNMSLDRNVSGANDDWLITPELSGNAQTITFWINAFYTQGVKGAKIAIMTSKTGTEISDFTALPGDTVTVLADGWKLFTCDESSIKEGTKYVAIHVMSDHEFDLFLDDFTYQPAIKSIKGYNIYEDGKLIGTTDGTTTYSVTTDGAGHKYNVTVIYENGESSFSNTASVATGISTVKANTSDSVEYYSIDGMRLTKPQRGICIIRMGDVTKKVVVK